MGRTGRWKDARAVLRELGRDSLATVPKWARITEAGQDVMYREVHGDDSTQQAPDRALISQADFGRVRQSAQDGRPADDL